MFITRRDYDLEGLFERFFNRRGSLFIDPKRFQRNEIDCTEKDMIITLAVPGYTTDDLNVSLKGNVLFIEGQLNNRASEMTTDVTKVVTNTKNYFERSYQLSDPNLDFDKLSVKLKDGVLIVTIPKKGVLKKNSNEPKVQFKINTL